MLCLIKFYFSIMADSVIDFLSNNYKEKTTKRETLRKNICTDGLVQLQLIAATTDGFAVMTWKGCKLELFVLS